MTLFDLFQMTGVVAGFCAGCFYGCQFGMIGAIVGAIVGVYLGFHAGNLPWAIMKWFVFRDLRRKSVSQLWEHLQDGSGPANSIVYELRRRGEPASKVLEAILSMLASDDGNRRCLGRVALNWAFPEATKYALAFKPSSNKEERQEAIEEIRAFLWEVAGEKCLVVGKENR